MGDESIHVLAGYVSFFRRRSASRKASTNRNQMPFVRYALGELSKRKRYSAARKVVCWSRDRAAMRSTDATKILESKRICACQVSGRRSSSSPNGTCLLSADMMTAISNARWKRPGCFERRLNSTRDIRGQLLALSSGEPCDLGQRYSPASNF